jgi:hypothetical protein
VVSTGGGGSWAKRKSNRIDSEKAKRTSRPARINLEEVIDLEGDFWASPALLSVIVLLSQFTRLIRTDEI